MGNVIILNSPTEKIIKLRKKHKLTQKDLVGEDLARSTLAMIETKKVNLTENVAKILVKNFNEIFIKKGIKEKVSYEKIMESEEEQAKKMITKLIYDFENCLDFNNIYRILNLFFIEEDYPKLMIYSYDILFREKYKNNDFQIAYELLEELIKACIRTKDIEKVLCYLKDMILCVDNLKNYNSFRKFLNIINPVIFNKNIDYELYFEIGKVFYNGSFFQEALIYFNYINKPSFDLKINYEYLSKKIDCYVNIGEFEKPLKLLRKLSRIKDLNIKFLVQIDFANFYKIRLAKGDYEKVKRYFWKMRTIVENIESKEIFFEKGLKIASIAEFLGMNKKAYEYYRNGIFYWKLAYNKISLIRAYKFVINQSTKNEINVINEITEILFQLIKKDKDFILLIFQILIYYKQNKVEDKVDYIINYMKEKDIYNYNLYN